ncbi:MAG: exonuclease SbcCD subunit D [Bacteroidales bacterium]|nr:exonuclease SbcCD subunit D C-terminal domain-containing protein [Anaerotignum sp.]MCI5679485.1 exonuclease SbcCD subunit D [Bacteroidales bacterium]MDY3927033.1 exonuclease SbcCD subunit D [Anaerotignum sp.]
MKFFHISDLHLGKRVYEFSMLEEQKELLRTILQKVEEEKPDALLITGDVYDKPVPPVEAVRLLDDFLTELSARDLHTYLIAGNHDSAQRLEFGKDIFGKNNIHIAGNISAKMEHFTVKDAFGPVDIWLLPFFKPAHVNGVLVDQTFSSYGEAAKALLDCAEIDFSKRNIVLVHQFVTWKGTAERSDSETMSLGGVDEIDASLFFPFDYAALGHLHSPQPMGKDTVRYAGSPMPYSFSEIRQKKGITVVELKEKGDVTFDFIPLETKRKFREIKGPLQELLKAAKAEGGSEDYIRCILTDQAALLDPIGQLRSVYPNLMTLEFAQKETAYEQEIIVDTEDMKPDELFSLFFEKQNDKKINEAQQKLLQKIWKGLEEEA